MSYGLAAPAVPPESEAREDPEGFIRRQWSRFVDLGPRIQDLQHRAAVLAGEAKRRGDLERHRLAKEVIRKLGRLREIHGKVLERVAGMADALGIENTGVGAIPFVAPMAVGALALVVLWVFRSYAAQERKLDMIEAGTLTPEQAAELDPGSPPAQAAGLIGEATGLLKWAALGLVVWAALDMMDVGLFNRNPPLVVYGPNPPEGAEIIGTDVEAIYYRHAEDGKAYVHQFESPGVALYGNPDGSVRVEHPDRRLWKDF